MKVILTAFQGKLKSEPMDWPDNSRPEIYMAMDMENLKVWKTYDKAAEFTTTIKKGKFEATGRYFVIGKGLTAEEYKLTDIS